MGEPFVLRAGVEIEQRTGHRLFRYAHWELRLPEEAVVASEALAKLIKHRRCDTIVDPAAQGVFALLSAQGCFLPTLPEHLSPHQVFELLQPLRSELYASYYRHPLWERLRAGTASLGQFVAWALHNYHISRSAGPIAARMASFAASSKLREAFRSDVLEEYWHCDAFYFVEGGRIAIEASRAKAYVPLAAVRAFEDVALRAASEDWLGHIMIAYFQESSVVFGDASEEFYDAVESRYHVPGFFRGWRRHLALDRDHGHADGLARLFDGEELIDRASVERSLLFLQHAHFYLIAALDQVCEVTDEPDEVVNARQPDKIVTVPRDFAASRQHWPYIHAALANGAFRALGLARDHDALMVAGDLAALMNKLNETVELNDSANPWLSAACNFLAEQAYDPSVFLALAEELILLTAPSTQDRPLSDRIARRRAPLDATVNARLLVSRIQLAELLKLADAFIALPPLALGLRSAPGCSR